MREGFGLEDQMLKADPYLGFTDCRTVKLDIDEAPLGSVIYWAQLTMKRFNLRGFVILKSSKNCYHVVFDRQVPWISNLRVVAWIALLSQNKGLIKWLLMQCIKGASTLRVTPKENKPAPRIVTKFGKQNHAIADFLKERNRIKRIYKRLMDEKTNGEN